MQNIYKHNYLTFAANKQKPVIIFDIDNGYKRYNSAQDAADAIYASRSSVTACACGHAENVAGKVSVFADKIEPEGIRGKFHPDIYAKVQLSLDKIRKKQIFLLNEKGNIVQKYPTYTSASSSLDIKPTTFKTNLAYNSVLAKNGLIPVSFNDIYSKDENFNWYVDESKIEKVLLRALSSKTAFYLVDRAKNAVRYKNIDNASDTLDISFSKIRYGLENETVINEEYVGIPAFGNEEKLPGEKFHLKSQMLDMAMEIFDRPKTNSIPVYSIDMDFNSKRYSSLRQAAAADKTYPSYILSSIKSNDVSPSGKIYCFAHDVESYLSDGTLEVDMDKMREIYESYFKKTKS